MRTNNYGQIWEEINHESKNNPDSGLIARKILSKSGQPVFLASDFGSGIRYLYIRIIFSPFINTERFPIFKGMEIVQVNTSIADCRNQDFLRISQVIPSTENIFELFISDICENIINLDDFQSLESTLFIILNQWKKFFEKNEQEILSLQAQQGLFGELAFFENYMLSNYSPYEAVAFWTGPQRANHDFQIENTAFEIKTTASKQHRKIYINSEKQLDGTGLKKLFLIVYSLNIHENSQERSLPTQINRIRTQIMNDSIALYRFEIQIAKSGYDKNWENLYKTGFSISNVSFYDVVEGFPCITQQGLVEGIGDIKYSIMVSACTQYRIEEQQFTKYV